MIMMQNIRKLQCFYLLTLVLPLAYLALGWGGVVPTEFVGNDARRLYYLELASVVTGLGGIYLALRWFRFGRVLRGVRAEDEAQAWRSYARWTLLRLSFLFVMFWSNALIFSASSYTATPKYSLLILGVAYVFCWPSKSDFESLRRTGEQEKSDGGPLFPPRQS